MIPKLEMKSNTLNERVNFLTKKKYFLYCLVTLALVTNSTYQPCKNFFSFTPMNISCTAFLQTLTLVQTMKNFAELLLEDIYSWMDLWEIRPAGGCIVKCSINVWDCSGQYWFVQQDVTYDCVVLNQSNYTDYKQTQTILQMVLQYPQYIILIYLQENTRKVLFDVVVQKADIRGPICVVE